VLSGKYTSDHVFEEDDHRNFNENGAAFNIGETFAGLGFKKGVEISDQLKWIAEGRPSMASTALRWILDQTEITCIIPGFKNTKQVADNLEALHTTPFSKQGLEKISNFYQQNVVQHIRGPY
jgi:aryl-alcohol dehydrogenase-like predicted oxidoreductase